MTQPRSRAVPRATLAVLLLALAALGWAGSAAAAPSSASAATQVTVLTPAWVFVGKDASIAVRVRPSHRVAYLSARFRIYDADGKVLWERTRSRSALAPKAHVLRSEAAMSELGLKAGVYSVGALVRADGVESPSEATGTLLVVDRRAPRLPVSVIVRVAGAPQRDTSGTFLTDPLVDPARLEADSLARLAMLRPELALSAVVPPYLLAEWGDAADGYDTAGATSTVSAESTGAVACRGTLDALGRAGASGLALLRDMYAEPSPESLALARDEGAETADQIALGALVASDTLGGAVVTRSVEPTGLSVPGGVLSTAAAAAVPGAGMRFVVLDPSSVRQNGRAVPTGAYTLRSPAATNAADLVALVPDRATARLLLTPDHVDEARARLLRRSLAAGPQALVVLELTVGRDAPMAAVQQVLQSLANTPWIRLVDAPTAAAMEAVPASLAHGPEDGAPAPGGYWAAIARARRLADALLAAAGPEDVDATTCVSNARIAGSRSWAGEDGSWALADRGLAYARAAETVASATLSAVRVDIPTMTLSGAEGEVPVSIQNGSEKSLSVVVTARSPRRVARTTLETVLLPGENILSVPVDLGQSLASSLTVSVSAGDLRIARSTSTVRGSYLDRIVMLAGVVLVLLALLWYIRAKARPALARRRGRADDSEREAAETPERHAE